MPDPSPFQIPNLTTPEQAWIAIGSLLVFIGVFQWGSVLYSKVIRRRQPPMDPDEESNRSMTSTRVHVPPASGSLLTRIPLAAVNIFRVSAFRWTLELGSYDLKVVDIVFTLGYIAFLFGWTFDRATQVGVSKSNLWLWSGRAGRLAASQLPLVTALGTKNNVVSLITGIGYEKLNYMHRVTARSCFLLLLFHAGGKIYSSREYGPLNAFFELTFVRFGLMAVSSFSIIVIVSLRVIRTRVYELFFYVHFVAVFVFLLAAYFHTSHVGFSYWVWPAFMFWALDRLFRLARVVLYNHLYCGFSRRAKLQDANTELLSDDFIRVRVRRPAHFEWTPGQTAYLIAPSVSSFPLEAHPFSISSVHSATFNPSTRAEYSETNGGSKEVADTAYWKELVFLINVRGGFTKRLKEVAAQKQKIKVFIDGPYGRTPDVAAYDTSIFVAGGSGITYTLPVFLNVIEAATKGSIQCRRVVFIWAVRDASQLHWISDELYQANALTPAWLNVSIRIFATRAPLNTYLEQTPDKGHSHDWTPPSVRLESGRPDLEAILRGEASTAAGSMSVTVCGSQSLTRSVRHALRFPVSGPSNILNGGPSVTLHVESFGYA